MEHKNYSVLMSVYHKEKPQFLRLSIESMFNQTIPTNDFVLVCDGPLNDELDEIIASFEEKYKNIFRVVRIEKNQGLGHALKVGVLECKNDIIARMDSDDISRPERCEKELEFLANNPEVSIVGALIEEFSDTPEVVNAMRVVPETHEEIIQFAKTLLVRLKVF